jgi:predicted transcriptional regulator of viral defense system
MKLISAYQKLKSIGQPFLQTRDAAIILGLNAMHTSKLLGRLVEAEQLIHLKRGLWGFPELIDPLILPQYLTAPFPSYISLQTALFQHDMISQIPSVIYVVSIARSKVIKTPVAIISVHHVDPNFFFGYIKDDQSGINLASPEKAIVDYFYFHPAKSKLFQSHPEIELPENFDIEKARKMIKKIKSKKRRSMVSKLFEDFFAKR